MASLPILYWMVKVRSLKWFVAGTFILPTSFAINTEMSNRFLKNKLESEGLFELCKCMF